MKRLILVITFLLFTFYFLPLTSFFASAQTSSSNSPWVSDQQSFQQNIKDGKTNLDNYYLGSFVRMGRTVRLAIDGEETLQQAGVGADGKPVYRIVNKGGATEILAGLTSSLYSNKPASGVEYLADLGTNIGVVKPALAQGLGFSAFSPVLELWKLFRNIAYLAFVVVFVLVGFMIMFRKKIDPRTVVTVQDAIPRIIVTMILVTFSYALAGFIIDIADLTTKIGANILAGDGTNGFIAQTGKGDPGVESSEKINRLLNNNIFALVNPLRSTGELFQAFQNVTADVALKELAAISVTLVFAVLSFFIMFKIFFTLIAPYVSIVLSIVFAPIILLKGAIPGADNNSVMSWLKGLISNVAVFPVTFLMLAIAAVFKSSGQLCKPFGGYDPSHSLSALFVPSDWATKCEPIATSLWVAPGIGNWGNLIGQLVSFGILFAVPKVAEIIKGALQVKEGIASQVAGQEIKGGLTRLPVVGSMIPK